MSGTEHAVETLEALRAEHGRLLKEAREDSGAAGFAEKVAQFLGRAKGLGRRLDDPTDREAAQSVLDYWTATLFTLPGGVATKSTLPSSVTHSRAGAVNVVLEEFDPATIHSAAADAERWLSGLSEEDRTVARRVMLRLVRLAADGKTFELVPAARASLYDVDTSPARVDEVISRLAELGVVRVSRGNTPETDQLALRSPSLREDWASLRGWLADRSSFRGEVESWDRSGRPGENLPTGKDLDERRSYHDRNVVEREFTEESRRQEIWINERNQRLKYVFGVLASLLLAGLIGTGSFAVRSNLNWKRAESEKREADKQRVLAEKSRGEAQKQRDLAEERGKILDVKQRLAEMTGLVRSLALLGNATGAEREVAYERLDATRKFKSDRPEIRQFFEEYGPSLQNARKQGSEEDLQKVKRAALNLARIYKGEILQIATSDEARKSLSNERDVIFAIVESCAGRIVQLAADGRPYHDADPYVKEFFVLYWGEMGIVEGRQVEGAMVRFGASLRQIDQRIADMVRTGKGYLKDPGVLKGLTNRQAIQSYYDEAKFLTKSGLGLEGVETITVDQQKELPRLREDLDALKRALAAERGRTIAGDRALDAAY